ncbi:DegQ family serine endoprotease [Nibricoccus sp. IMCC34717]|uniref:DegQ family serine endoprotease n=1 Tax=Nibricoccus sp. IMCC34717 TaxID=3034021 RepID=UPI00384E40F7
MTQSLSSLTRRIRLVSLYCLGGILSTSLAWADAPEKQKPDLKVDEKPLDRAALGELAGYSPIIKQVAPSVVKVRVTERSRERAAPELPPFLNDPRFREFFGPFMPGPGADRRAFRQPPQEGLGSGVIVSANGYIVTNNHVVQGADVIKVSLNDGRDLTARVVGTDPKSDLAVIKVDAEKLPAITFADSDKVEVGDRVLAIGNPFGIGQTVTSGMVSGLGRATMGLDYEDFIQTDAAINPGNSGGALVDIKGRLVGVNTAILSRSGGFQGIGFAIPSNMARSVLLQLADKGRVVRGFIGVNVQDVNEAIAESFKLKSREGALVSDTQPEGPASKGGIKSGDVIVKFDGKAVRDGRNLKLIVADVAPGTKVPVELIRDGESKTLEIKVGDQPRDRRVGRGDRNDRNERDSHNDDQGTLNGVMVSDLNPANRREFDIPQRIKGALVTDVDPESAAGAAGLQPGDVILEINRQPVSSADDAVKLTENPDSKKSVLRVWNQGSTRYVVVDETDESPAS